MFGSGGENDPAASIARLCEVAFRVTGLQCEGRVQLCSATQNEERGLTKRGFGFLVP